MQASMDFDEIKALKLKNKENLAQQPIFEESHPNDDTGNFDHSRESAKFKPNESRTHYMDDGGSSPISETLVKRDTAKSHYYEIDPTKPEGRQSI